MSGKSDGNKNDWLTNMYADAVVNMENCRAKGDITGAAKYEETVKSLKWAIDYIEENKTDPSIKNGEERIQP